MKQSGQIVISWSSNDEKELMAFYNFLHRNATCITRIALGDTMCMVYLKLWGCTTEIIYEVRNFRDTNFAYWMRDLATTNHGPQYKIAFHDMGPTTEEEE